MRLTNKQLEALSSKILKEINKKNESKVEEIKESDEFKLFLFGLSETKDYKDVIYYKKLKDQLDDIDNKKDKLKKEYQGYGNWHWELPSEEEFIDEAIKDFMNKKISTPSKQEIEEEIVLVSMDENKDIIETILNKY